LARPALKGYRLAITGHSLGAATTTLLTLFFFFKPPTGVNKDTIRACCFGCPPILSP